MTDQPTTAGLDALWEALAEHIHGNGFSVRDAIGYHRAAIEAEAGRQGVEIGALAEYRESKRQAAADWATIAALREALDQLWSGDEMSDNIIRQALANTAEPAAQEKARIEAPWRAALAQVHKTVCGYSTWDQMNGARCDCGYLNLTGLKPAEARALLDGKTP